MDDPKETLKTIKLIKSDYDELSEKKIKKEDIMQTLAKKYPSISDNFPALFSLVFNPLISWEKDLAKLEQMVALASRVKSQELSQHDASVMVGSQLCDEYVKPVLSKK